MGRLHTRSAVPETAGHVHTENICSLATETQISRLVLLKLMLNSTF